MLVWRKGNIEKKKAVSVSVLCTIIMVHSGISSSYRLVDWILLITLGLTLLYRQSLWCLQFSVSSVFMVFTIVPFFTLLIGELSLMGLALDLVEQPLSFSAVTLLVGSSDSQNRPQNDLQCVEWDVKTLLYHIIPDC